MTAPYAVARAKEAVTTLSAIESAAESAPVIAALWYDRYTLVECKRCQSILPAHGTRFVNRSPHGSQ